MSAIEFLTSGGIANIGGDLHDNDQDVANNIVKQLGKYIKSYAIKLQVPASKVEILRCNYLLIVRDNFNFYFVFANAPGGTSINYRNRSPDDRLELSSIVHFVSLEIGDVAWAFFAPVNAEAVLIEDIIQNLAKQYINTILQNQSKPSGKISNEAVASPEIASGIEKFRVDYPSTSKTAFIMMQFGNTKLHSALVTCIKRILGEHDIVALRADDKEYMDELFPNIKTYMHACDFGVAVFDRITEDDFNPNVSLEVGYMLGMRKNVLLLKDKTLKNLPTDLTGKLYRPFDTSDIEATVPPQIESWLSDKGFR